MKTDIEYTHKELIVLHFKQGLTITCLEALEMYGIYYLTTPIHLLRKKDKIDIGDIRVRVQKKNGKTATVKRYYVRKWVKCIKTMYYLHHPTPMKEPCFIENKEYELVFKNDFNGSYELIDESGEIHIICADSWLNSFEFITKDYNVCKQLS
jgi:hypothetical protein